MAGKTTSRFSVLKLFNVMLLACVGAVLVYQAIETAKLKEAIETGKLKEAIETAKLKEEIEDLKHANRQKRDLQSTVKTGGIVYTQWGRHNCTNTRASTVYSGVVGGSLYEHSGGGSNYLCLPMDPLWGNYKDGISNLGLIYGAEYQIDGGKNFPFYGRHGVLYDHNVPCAVCEQDTVSKFVMIPARNKCNSGWTEAYHGYLMTEKYSHKGRTEFVCMDSDPDRDDAGYRDENGVLFYTVEGVCGSLPCPPYVNGKELTCVVCVK